MSTAPLPLAEDPRHLAALAHHFNDHERWCEDALTIRDQKGNPVKFKTFPGPHKLNEAVERQRKQGKPVRILVLKARRVYISAAVSTHIFKHVAFFPGRHATVIAHKLDAAVELFSYYKNFARYYTPAGSHLGGAIELPHLAPSGQGDRSLTWADDRWIKVLAGIKDVGRSMGNHALHISEAAFIKNLSSVTLGLLNTMGDHTDTMAFKESTANGAAGEFYEDWQAASDPRSGSGWTTVFLAWWEHPSNWMAIDGPRDHFERSLCNEERDLQRTYTLSLEQLYWRRWAITNKCNRSAKMFAQEYPACPEEAFLTSGRPRFNHISLARHPIIREPITGELKIDKSGTRETIRFEAASNGDGPMLLYRRPQQGEVYTLGADVASGADPNFRTAGSEAESDPDYSTGHIIHCGSGEQVAKIRGRFTPPLFAEMLYALGWWYNWAYLIPEANNHGQAVIAELLRLQYPLHRLHVKRRIPGDRRPVMLNEIGFLTNVATRPDLVSGLDRAINDMGVIIRDANTVAECRKFVVWPDGTPRAAAGKGNHDDDVIGLALAVVGLAYAPRIVASELRQPQPGAAAQRKQNQIVRYGQGVRGFRDADRDDD